MLGILIESTYFFFLFHIFAFLFLFLSLLIFFLLLGHIGNPLLEGVLSLKELRPLKENSNLEREAGIKVYT